MKTKKMRTAFIGCVCAMLLCGCVMMGTSSEIATDGTDVAIKQNETVTETEMAVADSTYMETIEGSPIETWINREQWLPIEGLPDAINQVLRGEETLVFQGTGLDSIAELEIYLDESAEYAVIDFDKDGYNELVIHPPVYSYIFRYDGEKVYAYQKHYRPMAHLMDDGSYVGSGSATSTYYREFVEFTDTEFIERIYLTALSCEQTENGYEDGPIYYDENHNRITQEEADALLELHKDAKKIEYKIIYFH